jgi:hypothetical protein
MIDDWITVTDVHGLGKHRRKRGDGKKMRVRYSAILSIRPYEDISLSVLNLGGQFLHVSETEDQIHEMGGKR